MLPGPVFNLELLTTARRARYYAVRVVYGAVLLFVIFLNYNSWGRFGRPTVTQQEMTQFAATTFASFATVQALAVLGLTPALVSGVIVDEKQRKTLHYLLSSRLSSAEIILGKLSARMLHVFVFIAIGFPVISLLSLFGGVDPTLVLICELVTASTAFFLAGMSILVSTTAKRVRDAITLAYTLEAGWLILPSVVNGLVHSYWPETAQMLAVPLAWLNATDPLGLLWNLRTFGSAAQSQFFWSVFWMVFLQLAFGGLMAAIAVLRLRPIFRLQADAMPTRLFGLLGPRVKSKRFRLFRRPEVGDRAMLWKELHTARGGGARQLVELVLQIMVLGGLILWGGSFAFFSFMEMVHNGYDMAQYSSSARWEFNLFLRISSTVLCTLAALGTATVASNGMTQEREEDTWTALLATPLEAGEIVFGKMAGAVWRSRAMLGTALGLNLLGVLCGAVHPLGFVFFAIEVIVFVAFADALGTFFSLRSRTSWRAQSLTLGIWLFVNLGYGACCCPIAMGSMYGGSGESAWLFAAGCSPLIEGLSLIAPADLGSGYRGSENSRAIIAFTCLFGTIFYAIAACYLTGSTRDGFDAAVDRPRHAGLSAVALDALAKQPPKDEIAELA